MLNTLFSAVRQFVLDGGGDGDRWIVSPRGEELARQFESYENSLSAAWFTSKMEFDNQITFSNELESVNFVQQHSQVPPYGD